MMTSSDWAQMQADLTAVRGDNATSITIRRGNASLAAQSVRLAGTSSGTRVSGGNPGQESRGGVVILGATTLDIAIDDRFTVAGVLFRVTWIRPSRLVATMARAEAVQ